MELYRDILTKILMDSEIEVRFSGLNQSADQMVEMKCYQILKKIKAIIEDDSLEDSECFMKIEHIIIALEEAGSNGGTRHDFG